MKNALRNFVGLLLFVVIQDGYGMPQGFFSQALSIPKIVSWNGNDRSLAILPGVKVASPIKSSHISVFGKKNTSDKKFKKEQQNNKQEQFNEEFKVDQTPPAEINPQEKSEQRNNFPPVKVPNDLQRGEQLISKFSVDDNSDDNPNGDKVTTETLLETTTDDYETTTIDDDLFNRASPQLVASLLG